MDYEADMWDILQSLMNRLRGHAYKAITDEQFARAKKAGFVRGVSQRDYSFSKEGVNAYYDLKYKFIPPKGEN